MARPPAGRYDSANHFETWGDLRGVHWFNYSNPSPVLKKVGYNVETVIGVDDGAGNYNSAAVNQIKTNCTNARNNGLVNIVRLDWKSPPQDPRECVPKNSADYPGWRTKFNQAVNDLKSVATIFIVGNEPNAQIEGTITSTQYANAFNDLWPTGISGTLYLAAGPALWSEIPGVENDLEWMQNVANSLTNTSGFALHAYASIAEGCSDPRAVCNPPLLGGDRGFRRYRDFIEKFIADWADKPVCITEINTRGVGGGDPQDNYPTGFMQQAYEEVRNYNTETNPNRSTYPRVLCACWFVDDYNNDGRRHGNWATFGLSNTGQTRLLQARNDHIAANTATGITA